MIRFVKALSLLIVFLCVGMAPLEAAGRAIPEPKYGAEASGREGGQYSGIPIPLNVLNTEEKAIGVNGVWDKIQYRARKDPFNLAATIIFILAVIHTFLTSKFTKWSHYFQEKYEKKLELAEARERALEASSRQSAEFGGSLDREDSSASGESTSQGKKKLKLRSYHKQGHRKHSPVSFLSSVFHFLGEVEAVFGLWVIPLMGAVCWYHTFDDFKLYMHYDCSFIEPMFVTVVMIVASSRPLFRTAEKIMQWVANLGKGTPGAWWVSVLTVAPIFGSIVTEPAAMTIAAMILAKRFYALHPSRNLAYATLGLLFVNISIGGTLTHFAAPPVVMVAETWGWGFMDMLTIFGWKAVVSILLSSSLYYVLFRKEFARLREQELTTNQVNQFGMPEVWEVREDPIPTWVTIAHFGFLAWTVVFAHVPILFIGGFLFFLGFIVATPRHQNNVILRIPVMVGFFLAGLVILGGLQAWWLEPILTSLESKFVMIGATLLTAFNDNAAITYLASTVPDLPKSVEYAVLAGAVTGGGLTVIANAPNPAGQAILGKYFLGINPIKLFLAALVPTGIVYFMFAVFHSY